MAQQRGIARAAAHGLRAARIAAVALCCATVAACATPELPRIPPLTPQPTRDAKIGKFVWLDLVTQDVAESKAFYGSLLGWSFRDDAGYTPIFHDGAMIAGMVQAADPERGSEWLSSLSVADVNRAAALVKERGGLVERVPVDAPDRGRLAVVSDPEGALLLLVRSTGGDPPDLPPPVGTWLWRELWSHDVAASLAFYAALAGHEADVADFRGQPYHVLRAGGRPRAGVVAAPPEVHPLWLPYVRVTDAEEVAARAERLGARVVLRQPGSAILVDPTGAPFGLQEWQGPGERQAETER
jgi:predicted enzyme related to lactoylglutathione lyase